MNDDYTTTFRPPGYADVPAPRDVMDSRQRTNRAIWIITAFITLCLGLFCAYAGNSVASAVFAIFYVGAIWLYWLPVYIAWQREASNLAQVAMLTLFAAPTLGVTWLIALYHAIAPTGRGAHT